MGLSSLIIATLEMKCASNQSIHRRIMHRANARIERVIRLLHKALSNAVKWNILPRNVCDAVTPPRIQRKEKTVLTIEQAYTLLRQIKNHRMEALFTLAMVTGMRRGELLASGGISWPG